MEAAVLAGGCFRGVEEILREVPGVLDIMNAGVAYDVLERAVPIHLAVSELNPMLLGELRPAE